MKKMFVSLLALAAFAGCSERLEDGISIDKGTPEQADRPELLTVYAEVSVNASDETRATYGDDLSARWEADDRIAVFQEYAAYGSSFSTVSRLAISEGVGTASARFAGEIAVGTTEPRRFHVAYPHDAVSFETSTTVTSDGDPRYNSEDATVGCKYSATGTYTHTYTNRVRLTVPERQRGTWNPYMFASTAEAVAADRIGTRPMTVLSGAIALRVFESDGKTPKRVKRIVVSADTPLVGAFTGSSVSSGSTGEITGAISGWHALGQDTKAKNEALANLESKARETVPATVVSVSELALDGFEGGSTSVELDDLLDLPSDGEGNFIYYANIAPVAVDGLTITLVDENNFEITRKTAARTFRANTRSGYNIRWDDASISMDDATSWFDQTTGEFTSTLAGNTLYCDNLRIGGVDAGQIVSMGIDIDGEKHPLPTATYVPQTAFELPSGEYTACAYAEVRLSDGSVETLTTAPKTLYVTAVPELTCTMQTSYESTDGSIARSNAVDGYTLWFRDVAINDPYLRTLSDGMLTFVYGDTTEQTDFAESRAYEKLTPAKYAGCAVRMQLANGYVASSTPQEMSVTGIPYTLDVTSNDGTWSKSGAVDWNKNSSVQFGKGLGKGSISKSFYTPVDMPVRVQTTGSVSCATIRTTFTLTCNGQELVNKNPKSGNEFRPNTENFAFDGNVQFSSDCVVTFNNSYGSGATGANLTSFRVEYAD